MATNSEYIDRQDLLDFIQYYYQDQFNLKPLFPLRQESPLLVGDG